MAHPRAFSRPTRALAAASVLSALLALPACERPVDSEALIPPTQPRAVRTPPPDYPLELACYGQGGTAELLLEVGVDGRPHNLQLERSSGHPQLDQAALDAVTGWEFTPGTRGGEPVATDLRVPVRFRPPVERPQRCNIIDEQR